MITQIIMAAVLVAVAATLGKSGGDQRARHGPGNQRRDHAVPRPDRRRPPVRARHLRRGAGRRRSSSPSTAARTLAEVLGVNHSLDHEPSEAPWFYGAYAAALIVGALVVASGVNLVALSVGVQVMNALLLPIVLGFLFLLARGLPEPYRLRAGTPGSRAP